MEASSSTSSSDRDSPERGPDYKPRRGPASVRVRVAQGIGFAAGLVVLDLMLGSLVAGLGSHADPKSSPIGLLEAVGRHPTTEVLMLGSSRANHHLDPEVLGPALAMEVHNAGLDGQGIVFARAVQEFAWDRGLRPAVVLLQVEAFDVMSWEPERAHAAARYLSAMPKTRAILEAEGYNVRVKLLSRSFRLNSLLVQLVLNRIGGEVPAAGEDSFGALTGSLQDRTVAVQGMPGRWAGRDRELHPKAVATLRELMEDVAAAGAQPVLVTGPHLRRSARPPEEQAAIDSMAVIAEAAGGTLIEINEETHPILDDPALYSDPSHLNAEGARIYSEIVADRLRQSLR